MRVVVYQEGEVWIAQGLEHDICVSATDLPKMIDRWDATVEVEIALAIAFGKPIPFAPKKFFEMWTHRSKLQYSNTLKDIPFHYLMAVVA